MTIQIGSRAEVELLSIPVTTAPLRQVRVTAGLFQGPIRDWLHRRDEGGAIVELAIVMPLLLILTTAIFTFGIAMNNYQMLTHGVNQGGLLLQELRSMPGASDPCLAVANAVIAAAPNLSSSGANGLQLTVQLDNGAVSYGPVSASSATCTAGAAYLSQSTQGTNVTVTATYSCNLTIFGVNYAPSCVLSSSTTEQMQ